MARLLFSAYGELPTERSDPRFQGLDTLGVPRLLDVIFESDRAVPRAVAREKAALIKAVALFVETWKAAKKIVLVGAGTSGRLCVLEAAECPPTFGTSPSRIRAIMAGGKGAVFKAVEGAEDDAGRGAALARAALRRGDMLVGVAASGVTPFVLGALRAAKRKGARTILVTSNGRPALRGVDVLIAPRVGAEVVAGSTRLKSGTAAKLVLNTLTTAAMVRLGKVHGNRMVDPRPGSRKLRSRAIRNVSEIAGVGPARAEALLRRSGGRVKLAVLLAEGLGRAKALRRLADAGGFLRGALKAGAKG